jgi:ubiquinone/menaquinone biosynthesis C-methylase UbiE
MAEAMLALARRHVAEARLQERIACVRGDAKALPWADGRFEAVISNTIIHHIPEPSAALAEMARLVTPGGTLFVRDLARPATLTELAHLVATYAGNEPPAARQLFEASLHAALTVAEVQSIALSLGLPRESVAMTSDRHWTCIWKKP